MVVLTEGRHPAEFILSEANGQRSRGSATILASDPVNPGQLLKLVAATTDEPTEHHAPITAMADINNAVAIAIYGAAPDSGDTIGIATLERDAEVNGKILELPGDMNTENHRNTVKTKLASLGIIVRGLD